ncbi:MAG TPA: hypothetical protein VF483_13390 [Gemmatimonadaceae bacterium]
MRLSIALTLFATCALAHDASAQRDTTKPPAASPNAATPGALPAGVVPGRAMPPGMTPGANAPVPVLPVGPPVRRITTAAAVTKDPIGAVSSVRELPDGRVILNDGTSRRLLLLDTNLVTERVLLDSASEHENTYGVRQGTLIAHRGDSSLFIDPASLALLVIDPQANITRVRSVPRAQEAFAFTGGFGATQVATDSRGRLIYSMYPEPAPPKVKPPKGVPWFPSPPDSNLIVALDLETRKVDTLGAIRTPKVEYIVKMNANGGFNINTRMNPTPTIDEWAVLPDGSVAFVRGIDYRVEYRSPDGQWTSTPKVPYDWQPFPDSMKKKFVDSIETNERRNARNAYVTSMVRWVNTYKRKYPPNFAAPDGYRPPNGFGKDWAMPSNVKFPDKYIYACKPDEEPAMIMPDGTVAAKVATEQDKRAANMEVMVQSMGITLPAGFQMPQGGPGTPSCIPQPIPNLNQIPNPPTPREVNVIGYSELADFKPPFNQSAVRADLDGNLWIRINMPRTTPGGPIYDVVNKSGQIVDRIQIPQSYTLVGFGRGKVVFVAMRDATGAHLARVRMKPVVAAASDTPSPTH